MGSWGVSGEEGLEELEVAVAGGGDAVAGKGGLVAGAGHAAEGGGIGGELDQGAEPGVVVEVGHEAAVFAVGDHVHDAGDLGGDDGELAGEGFEDGEALGFGFGGEDEGVGGLQIGGDVGDVAGEADGGFEGVVADVGAQVAFAGEVLAAAGADEDELGGGMDFVEALPDAQEPFEAFAAIELAGVGEEEGVGGGVRGGRAGRGAGRGRRGGRRRYRVRWGFRRCGRRGCRRRGILRGWGC
jgi:hypothetical protein